MIWIFLAVLAVALLGFAAWRVRVRIVAKRQRARMFVDVRSALERDIAAAEAKGLKVDRTDRIAPSRPRIKF